MIFYRFERCRRVKPKIKQTKAEKKTTELVGKEL